MTTPVPLYFVKNRRDTSANWSGVNPILRPGEIGLESNTGLFKFGDGVHHWNNLSYANAYQGGGSIASVNGQSGVVVLTASDVGADASGAAATAQTNAEAYTDSVAAGKAPLASPAFTGTPTGPTAGPGTNTTQLATTAFVAAAVAGGGGAVSSVFGRTGAVTAQSSDYSAYYDAAGAASTEASRAEAAEAKRVTWVTPSSDATGATDAAAINTAISALPSTGGVVRLSPGAWYIKCGQVVVNKSGIYIDAPGCFITAKGTGDMLRMYDSSAYESRTIHGGGLTGYPFVVSDGSASQSGWHAGDIFSLQTHGFFSDFTGSGSVGCLWDNQWAISEQMDVDVWASNCATHFEWTQNPAVGNTFCYGSYERSRLRLRFSQNNATFAVCKFNNGVYFDGSTAEVKGNITGTNAAAITTAVFSASGTSPSGSQDGTGAIPSNFANVPIDCNVELDDNDDTDWTFNPTTFAVSGDSYFGGLTGRLNFGAASRAWTPTTAFVGFYGETDGADPGLVSQTTQAQLFQGQTAFGTYAGATTLTSGSTISSSASWAIVTSSTAVTGLVIGAGIWDGQLVWLLNSGSFRMTMAASGTSNVASGTNDVIPAGQMAAYMWSVDTGAWYRVPQGTYTAYLTSNVESPTSGTALASITGLATALTVGTWKIRGYFPVEAVTTAATAKFALSFGGTATSANVAWQGHGSAFEAPQLSTTLTTETATGVTTSTTVIYYMELTATVTVSAAGTLQAQCANGTTGDAFNVLAGAFIEASQVG